LFHGQAHPSNVILLTCDGYGVLPPVSRLSREQVIYHFIAGYTSKMAGTEEGITKPVAAFSACFGEPFLVWHPVKYATMLADRLEQHQASAWLLNTGWIGGAKGRRCPLKYTRAIIDGIHSGALDKAEYKTDPVFKLDYPTTCPSKLIEITRPRLLHPISPPSSIEHAHLVCPLWTRIRRTIRDSRSLVLVEQRI